MLHRMRFSALLAVAIVLVATVALSVLVARSGAESVGTVLPTRPPPAVAAAAAGAASPASVRVAVGLERPRYLQLTRQLEVTVRNESAVPFEVVGIALDPGSRFAPAEGRSTSTTFEPGERIDMKVTYGDVRCADRPAAAPRVQLAVRTADGAVQTVEQEPEDGEALLGRLHDAECAADALQRTVAVGFTDTWTREGEAVYGTIALDRRAGHPEPVTLVEAAGTVIFGLHAEPQLDVPWATLPPDGDHAEVGVSVTADRCDAHAVADSKKSFQFRSWIALGDDEVFLELVPTDAGRQLLDGLIQSCLAAAAQDGQ